MNRRVALYILLALTVLMLADGKYGLLNTMAPYKHLITVEEIEGAGMDPGTPSAERSGLLNERLVPGEVLKITNDFGNIDISGRPETEEVQLDYQIYVYAASEGIGEAYLDELELRAVRSGEGLDVSLVEPAQRPEEVHQVRVDISGSMPNGTRIELNNRMGKVRVQNVSGPSVINNAFNDTTIKEIHGNLYVDAAYTNLDITGVRGDLVVKGNYGSSSLRNIDGSVSVKSDFRLTSLSDINGNIEAEASFGGINANEVVGNFKAHGSYTVIGARNVTGNAMANTEYGTVHFQGVERDIAVGARRSNITIVLDQTPDHRIFLENENGNLSLKGTLAKLQPQTGTAGKKTLNAVVGAGTHNIHVSNVQGNISIDHPPHP
jgi:hypothetical protein